MAEFSREEDLLDFMNELPEDLFGLNESLGEKVISFDDFFQTGLLMMPGIPDLCPRIPVQVEDSAVTLSSEETMSREMKIPVPGFITKSSKDTTVSKTLNAPGKRKRTADEMPYDSDSDDEESSCSGADSQEKSLEFAEQFLAYGVRCKPFFWQYNRELRGPKAKRLFSTLNEGDFHVLSGCVDPAFDCTQDVASISRYTATHGRGNDLRPDPSKLLNIGSRISGMEEMCKSKGSKDSGKQMEATAREKSKLASRICRLRKKAQYEANKIKLEGLQKEQNQLISVSLSMLNIMHDRIMKSAMQPNAGHSNTTLSALLKALISEHLGFMVAGHTVEYVNRELETVAKQLLAGGRTQDGQSNGGG